MSEHRVTMLGASLRRAEDPERSRDPQIRALVGALGRVEYAPAPSAQFRDELRAQLVAVAPRIIAESAPTRADAHAARTSTVVAGRTLNDQARRRRFTRPLVLATGVAAAFLMLFGGAVWMSQKSLPGDSLYGLKRTSEDVRLSLASGGTDRGHDYLSLAQTRVEEAQALLRRDSASASGTGALSAGLSPQTAGLISANLASADADLRHGSDLLDTQAVTADSQSPIAIMTGWAPGQLDRLHELAAALPAGPVQDRTRTSWTLTSTALTRARSLAPAVASGCASTATTDQLGPVPTCATATPAPRTSRAPGAAPTSAPAPTSRSTAGATVTPRTSRTPTAPAASPTPPATPSSTAPGLPNLLPSSGPVSIGRCGISVSLGPVGIGVGGCPSHS